MYRKKLIKSILALLIIFTQIITLFPTSTALADSNSKNYLVLVEQKNGTFIAHEDLALVTAKDKLMVKAKPLAKALGFSYTNGNGKKKGCIISNGNERNVYTKNSEIFYYYSNKNAKPKSHKADYKQSTLQSYNVVHYKSLNTLIDVNYFNSSKASDYDKLGFKGVIVYYKNNSNNKNTQKVPSLSQISNIKDIYPSYNDSKVKCKHDCPLCDRNMDCDVCILCYYYNWKTYHFKDKDWEDYWKYFNWKDFNLKDFDWKDFDWDELDWDCFDWDNHDCHNCPICDDGDDCNDCPFCHKYNNIDKPTTQKEKVSVQPVTFRNSPSSDAIFVEATYTLLNSSKEITLDLSKVLDAFKYYQLPYDGIYGFGSCDKDLLIQGINRYGKFTDVKQISKGEFTLDFPGAVSLVISGDIQNLILDFTPVKPIVIGEDAKLPLGAIDWLNTKDKYYRQYFVIADFMKFNLDNITLPYTLSRKAIEYGNSTVDTDYSTAFQRITIVFKGNWEDMLPYNRYINFKMINKAIDHPLVIFYDNGNTLLPEQYENDVITMIAALFSKGYNIYYPSKNWEGKVIMTLNDGKENVRYDHIKLNYGDLDLDYFYDYYTHLHEMAHFYEAQQLHYGFQFDAWADGNAITLAQKSLKNVSRISNNVSIDDYFYGMYNTNFGFLTNDNKRNFEDYYLNVEGNNAALIGYHFTTFIQQWYGDDVVNRILENVYEVDIPNNLGRKKEYDKKFTQCIKDATSENVFNLFISRYVNN